MIKELVRYISSLTTKMSIKALFFLVINDKSSGNCLSLIFVRHVLGSEFGRV